jgi:ABC-2 type transport system permease protein
MGTLTAVELRKATDTRAGFWLQLATAGLALATVLIVCITGDHNIRALDNVFFDAVQPVSILLPVVGILLVTSEWSQRTALVTFTLVPKRGNVLLAKTIAGVLIGLVATTLCLVISLFAAAAFGGELQLSATMIAEVYLFTVTAMVMGIGFGAMLQTSAPAIVISFVAPLAIGAVASIHSFTAPLKWVDQTRSLAPLTDHPLSADEWARASTTLLVWMAIPLAIGALRLIKGEVR